MVPLEWELLPWNSHSKTHCAIQLALGHRYARTQSISFETIHFPGDKGIRHLQQAPSFRAISHGLFDADPGHRIVPRPGVRC